MEWVDKNSLELLDYAYAAACLLPMFIFIFVTCIYIRHYSYCSKTCIRFFSGLICYTAFNTLWLLFLFLFVSVNFFNSYGIVSLALFCLTLIPILSFRFIRNYNTKCANTIWNQYEILLSTSTILLVPYFLACAVLIVVLNCDS